jgi:sugar fermentation stimulation protein A
VRRYQRFLMDLRVADGRMVTVHCPNSGSMEGCLEPGALVLASPAPGAHRRLAWTAEWIRLGSGVWVGLNTHRTNRLAEEALRAGAVAELAAWNEVRAEVPYGRRSRVDFVLERSGRVPCHVEVKNATWPTPDGGIGFPDSVTERGRKHLRELALVVRRGGRAALLFLVNRGDGAFVRPAVEHDPAYARELVRAARAGVRLLARRVRIAPPVAVVAGPVPIRLPWRRRWVPLEQLPGLPPAAAAGDCVDASAPVQPASRGRSPKAGAGARPRIGADR